jgi:hypothetical protein
MLTLVNKLCLFTEGARFCPGASPKGNLYHKPLVCDLDKTLVSNRRLLTLGKL